MSNNFFKPFYRLSKVIFRKEFYYKLKEKFNLSKKSPYVIISLGTSCYPKTILTRWKLKRKKAHGELTLPFDLIWVHEAVFVTDFIKNDFKDFFDDLRYIKEIKCWDNFRKINFSHETNFGPNDRELLIEKYSRRIANFSKYLNDAKPILFVQFLKDKSVGEDVNNLYETIKSIRGEKPFELIVIDCIDIVKNQIAEINLLKIKNPFDDCNLYDPRFYTSRKGKKFEAAIIKYCEKIIKNKLKCKVVRYL